ncbi:uncharacterized protein LOC106775498 isoform X1 [Vigna radiata var. radiata]|uniref:Uncharacterized protein LOC106775498 isoform X1 n=1 Tax=Vigna radiata var. radiata TaxID=3916 RepID=A0A1S3VIK3_VIGRR|nr:uncharacterized protein LOC106775498 isoform X1 [Vigna radiata var. radiata]
MEVRYTKLHDKMEVLYTKLHDKYTEVKTKKLSDLEHLNEEQQLKFINCLSAAEEVIEHLKTEKEELLGQVNDLRVELASLRAAKDNQLADYQMLLMEESHKNEALSEEVEKLQQLCQEGASQDLNNSRRIVAVDDQFKANSNRSYVRMTRKRIRQNALKDEARFISFENDQVNSVERESMHNACKETASGTLLECGSEANVLSGLDLQETGHGDWLIPVLFEYALGMKFSTYCQTGRICLSALHLSSGYSFSLSWICKAPEEEAELMYHVLSLGTFERVAPEWMREDIVFSPSMCSVFFERNSKLCCTSELVSPETHFICHLQKEFVKGIWKSIFTCFLKL